MTFGGDEGGLQSQASPPHPTLPSGHGRLSFTASQSSYGQPVAAYNPGQRQVTPVKLVPAGNATGSSNYGPYPAATTSQQSLPPPSVPSYAPAASYAPPATTSYNASPASYAGKGSPKATHPHPSFLGLHTPSSPGPAPREEETCLWRVL